MGENEVLDEALFASVGVVSSEISIPLHYNEFMALQQEQPSPSFQNLPVFEASPDNLLEVSNFTINEDKVSKENIADSLSISGDLSLACNKFVNKSDGLSCLASSVLGDDIGENDSITLLGISIYYSKMLDSHIICLSLELFMSSCLFFIVL